MQQGYLAVVLDRQSHLELKKLAKHEKVHCHHANLQFGVRDVDVADWIGRTVEMKSRWLYQDNDAAALTIQFMDPEVTGLCWDRFAHITLSCAEGVKPSYSNKMIEESSGGDYQSLGDIPLLGEIEFIAFDPQPEEYRLAANKEKPVERKV